MARLIPLLCTLLSLPGIALAIDWHSINQSSFLKFVPSYEGTELPSVFRSFDVQFNFDPNAPDLGCLEVRVDILSADMEDTVLNTEIAEPGWFWSSEHPHATFRSEDIRPNGAGGFIAHGTLHLKDVERTVNVPFEWTEDNMQARMTGSLTLDRSDFSIGIGEWAPDEPIAHEVSVHFDVKLQTGD